MDLQTVYLFIYFTVLRDGGLKRAAVPPRLKAQEQLKLANNLKLE